MLLYSSSSCVFDLTQTKKKKNLNILILALKLSSKIKLQKTFLAVHDEDIGQTLRNQLRQDIILRVRHYFFTNVSCALL